VVIAKASILCCREPVGGLCGLSTNIFDDGRISERRFERARTAVRLELEPSRSLQENGLAAGIRQFGTVRVIADVLRRLNPDSPHVTLDNLRGLADRVIAPAYRRSRFARRGRRARARVSSGLAILLEIVENLGIDRIRIADGAMREGCCMT